MDIKLIETICLNQSLMTGVPINLRNHEGIIARYESVSFPYDLCIDFYDRVKNGDRPVYHVNAQLMMQGYVPLPDMEMAVIIGPGLSTDITEDMARDILQERGIGLEHRSALLNYMTTHRRVSVNNFARIILLLHASLNHVRMDMSELFDNSADQNDMSELYGDINRVVESEENQRRAIALYSNEFERKMFFFISHGMVTQLTELLHSFQMDWQGLFAYNPLRWAKNQSMGMLAGVNRAGVAGGLDPSDAFELYSLYTRKIEIITSLTDLNNVNGAIPLDYCKRVNRLRSLKSQDPIVLSAVGYIQKHLNEKMTLPMVASSVFVTPQYLSMRFSKQTGMTLMDYITRCKIDEAKRLLQFSTYSLHDISEALSFSSQSHFQSRFKALVGMTPIQYRRNVHY